MSHSKRVRARSRLFSLSARVERRAAMSFAAVSHGDDGCPVCVAARDNPDAVMSFFPGRDGSAPALPEEFLIAEARRRLADTRYRADAVVTIIEYGAMTESGAIAKSAFTVDRAGRIFWTSSKERRLAAQIPPEA